MSDSNVPVVPQGSTNDPLYIHHSDSPTVVFVSPPLTGDNYGTWFRAITRALRAKNKFGFVDEKIKKPKKPDEIAQWESCHDLVSSWLLNSVSAEIKYSILYADSATEIWDDLKERFSQTNSPKFYQLKQSIAPLKQVDTSISAYFTKLKALWDELNSLVQVQSCTCGNRKAIEKRLQEERAMEFLQGLHD